MTQARLLVDQVGRIVALDKLPILRNLLITQCYHDLSSELSRVLGAQNVNWCSYATWASKTAGRFIRNDEIPGLFRKLLDDSYGFRKSAKEATDSLKQVHPETGLEELDPLYLAERITGEVSGQITAGNLKVFSELAPVFARFIHVFDRGSLDETAAAALLVSLRVGPSAQDGQSLLKEALEQYLAAARDSDPTRKAQHMLAANALTGLHEQIRLQTYIAGSLNAPISTVLAELWSQRSAENAHPSLFGQIHALWDKLGAQITHDADKAWDLFSAVELMTLTVPGQVLKLGDNLPPVAAGNPLYPAELLNVLNAPAYQLLDQYNALDPRSEGHVGASDWTVLAQRMRYIIALFRSRQQLADILDQPFSAEQLASLWNDEVPAGPL